MLIIFLFTGSVCPVTQTAGNVASTRLWYRQPAINWNGALPVGNGSMGAMIFGGVVKEHIPLNEQTLWSGAPHNWNNPEAKKYLPLVRAAVAAKNYKRADSLAKFMQGPYTESYLPLADLDIAYKNLKDSSNYLRELNIDSAISKTSFSSNGNKYTRTVFASYPDQVIVYHDTSEHRHSVSFSIQLSSKLHYNLQTIANNHIVLKGKCPKHVDPVYLWKIKDSAAIQYANDEKGEGMNFEVNLLVNANGGVVRCVNNIIQVEGASATTVIIAAATSYNGFDKSPGLHGKDPAVQAAANSKLAAAKSYQQLLQNHLADYIPFFSNVHLNLGESIYKDRATDERMKEMDEYADPEMITTIFQYGRYLLIAGSRTGGQPVNLKGIWNDKVRPEYSSNWCIDHDAQMFYYPVETTNLSAMHQPFLRFIEDLSINGKQTAAINYGMKGWCAHHNTDIWRQTGPVGNYGGGNPHWASWNMPGPWLSAHLYDHYLFTGDRKFLLQHAWPVMKGAALFCLDWLTKDSNGLLMSVPSVSPENTFITKQGDTAMVSSNSTADIALIKQLFTQCIATAEILQVDRSFSLRLKEAAKLLAPYKIGSQGQLLEWAEEWKPVDPAHRHLSHMYPVFPGNEISSLHTPALAIAAKKALSLREKTNCSWGFAWKAACWARLGEGDSAWQTLQYQLRYVAAQNKSADNYGLFPNLFNSEGSSTILNGNGCTTAVITEMLLQSHTGEIQLLPALPSWLEEGNVTGLCARGGFVVDISWRKHSLVSSVIYSSLGNECRLQSRSVKIFEGSRKIATWRAANNVMVFKTEKGKKYTIRAA
ncbi:MAG: glycoside hydrolase family 95 protein [Chitinophagaceae bacterium]